MMGPLVEKLFPVGVNESESDSRLLAFSALMQHGTVFVALFIHHCVESHNYSACVCESPEYARHMRDGKRP